MKSLSSIFSTTQKSYNHLCPMLLQFKRALNFSLLDLILIVNTTISGTSSINLPSETHKTYLGSQKIHQLHLTPKLIKQIQDSLKIQLKFHWHLGWTQNSRKQVLISGSKKKIPRPSTMSIAYLQVPFSLYRLKDLWKRNKAN